jgi:hypothetical protein
MSWVRRKRLDEAQLREDAEAWVRGQRKWRTAQQRTSDDQRGLEVYSERVPFIHRP